MNSNFDPRFKLRPSKIYGTGCFTPQSFKKRDFIRRYEGERISPMEVWRRAKRKQSNRICYGNSNWAIDGSFGNGTNYNNHSGQPNCYLVFNRDSIMIYALKNIEPGEELTVDYYYEPLRRGKDIMAGQTFAVKN